MLGTWLATMPFRSWPETKIKKMVVFFAPNGAKVFSRGRAVPSEVEGPRCPRMASFFFK
jgi:hypothetical protein